MTAERILETLRSGGAAAYFGEPVTQLEHALQTAALAERDGAGNALVVAALLHDIGHLVHGMSEDVAGAGIDARHESAGSDWLGAHFPPEVTEPIRLHVAAKRYLCATDPRYAAALSPASRDSLALQGGAMTTAALREFERNRFAADAIALRKWDDAAKVPGADVPRLSAYHARVARCLRSASA
jgi:[1-hydroxy-2-(trimethylamino)ethyl]phosphonate dioxygenase